MAKLKWLLLFLPLSVLAAGLFGVLHDQISYTVSSEYYTKFKFLQFRLLDASIPERLRAAAVGFLASWWMGIPLGLFSGLGGLVQVSASQTRRALLWSLPVIFAFTLLFALGGLAYGYAQTATFDLAAYQGWFIPEALVDPRRFLCAGYMHNAAYLGGVLSIPFAWMFHLAFRWRHTGARAG